MAGEKLADLELEVIRRFVSARGRVLDIGCGRGRTSDYLSLEGLEVIGVDLDWRTLKEAKAHHSGSSSQFVLADGRRLCFRDGCFGYVVSLASTLSEKHRVWMSRKDRQAIILEATRLTKPGGLIVFNFVHRYWNTAGFLKFLRYYWMWIMEKTSGKRTELGDYVENFGRTQIRFHAFTIREARSLFPQDKLSLMLWKRGRGPFTDWFFLICRKKSLST